VKKLLSSLAGLTLVFMGTTPAQAEIVYSDNWQGYNPANLSRNINLSVSGSIVEGQKYRVVATGACPGNSTANYVQIFQALFNGNVPLNGDQVGTNTFSYSSSEFTAPGPESGAMYGVSVFCSGATEWIHAPFMRIIFEAAVSSPVNFSVFPQASGTAFTTWGVASGATSYTVTATPGGATCTTSDNYCVVSGLTPGETYNFSVVATDGTFRSNPVQAGPVVLREPVTVGVGLNGGTWRVGETVTAQYVVQGSNATPTITWYRCNGVVGAMPSPPAAGDCSSVGSGASYVLAAGDVGKYVTANVFVNNTDPQGQMTASSFNAVLASGAVAPAPVADPAGNPTIVNIPNPIVSVAGGTEVTITGTGLAGVTGVTVGGLPAIVVSKTDNTVVVQVPVSTKVGLADLTITNSKGSVTSKSAIIYALNPVIKITKTKTITGFKAGQKVLTATQKTAVKALITANPTLTTLACAAKTTGVASNKTELAKAKTLATATCAYAKTLKKTLIVSSTASQSLPKSKASRSVALTLKN
jgi:hypothetical protein